MDNPGPDAVPVSTAPVTSNCVRTVGDNEKFTLLPPVNSLSDFEANTEWSNISEGFDYAREDPTILLDRFFPPNDMCLSLAEGIRKGTASVVSDGSFQENDPDGPVGTSAVILAPSATSEIRANWARGENWVTGCGEVQSAYRSELAGVIAGLTIVDIIVHHHNITEGSITFALDGQKAMDQCAGDWPLSIDQPCFDYLQVI